MALAHWLCGASLLTLHLQHFLLIPNWHSIPGTQQTRTPHFHPTPTLWPYLSVDLTNLDPSHKWPYKILVLLQLFFPPVDLMSSRFINTVACVSFLPLWGWLFHGAYTSCFVYPFISAHFGGFYLSTVGNKAVTNTGVQLSESLLSVF